MEIKDIAQNLLNKVKQNGADAADVLVCHSHDLSASTLMAKPEGIEEGESLDYGIRAFVGNRSAIVSASDVSEAGLTKVAERVTDMAKLAPEDKFRRLAENSEFTTSYDDLNIYDESQPSANELQEYAKQIEESALENKAITNSEGADASFGKSEYAFMTSKGFSGDYKSSGFSAGIGVIAGKGQDMQRDWESDSKRFYSDMQKAADIGKIAAQKTVKKLNPKKLDSCQLPLVFDRDVASSLLSTFASSINGNKITKGVSFLKDMMNKDVFSKDINIFDDPYIKRAMGSRPFDAEGLAAKKLQLVENGTLKHWLLDIRSGAKLNMPTNGRASRGAGSHPFPSSTNLYMQAGKTSELDIIKGIKKGVYITEAFGMGINAITGDYSQGAGGFMIENGELTYPISEITIASNMIEMFKNLIPADNLEFKYSTNAPSLLIDGMTIAGS